MMDMTASDIEIRPAEAGDIGLVQDIYANEVLNGTASFELTPPDRVEMTSRWRRLADAGLPYLVATKDGVVLGYAYCALYRERPAYRHTVEDSVYVAPDARGLKIGSKLLQALITQCEASGFRQMVAVIGDSRNAASINLHRALGFTFTGTFHDVGYKHGRWLDTVLMQRTLGDGATTPPAIET